MAYTWGASANDYMSVTMPHEFPSTNRSNILVCGWFYPTALTIGRYLIGSDNAYLRVYIANPANDLIALQRFSGTSPYIESTGNTLVTNTWQFIAALFTCEDTTPNADLRLYRGTDSVPPAAMSYSDATGCTGTLLGGTDLVIGNQSSTGGIAFQGDIGWLAMLHDNSTNGKNLFGIETVGDLVAGNVAYILNTLVVPMWNGTPPVHMAMDWTKNMQALFLDLSGPVPSAFCASHSNSAMTPLSITTSGPTYSAREPPTRLQYPWPVANRSPRMRI